MIVDSQVDPNPIFLAALRSKSARPSMPTPEQNDRPGSIVGSVGVLPC